MPRGMNVQAGVFSPLAPFARGLGKFFLRVIPRTFILKGTPFDLSAVPPQNGLLPPPSLLPPPLSIGGFFSPCESCPSSVLFFPFSTGRSFFPFFPPPVFFGAQDGLFPCPFNSWPFFTSLFFLAMTKLFSKGSLSPGEFSPALPEWVVPPTFKGVFFLFRCFCGLPRTLSLYTFPLCMVLPTTPVRPFPIFFLLESSGLIVPPTTPPRCSLGEGTLLLHLTDSFIS